MDDDLEDDEDSYYQEELATGIVKNPSQTTIPNNGTSGGTLSIRNAKSVSKKNKPVINVRPLFIIWFYGFIGWPVIFRLVHSFAVFVQHYYTI